MHKIKFVFLVFMFFMAFSNAQTIEVKHPNAKYGMFSTYYLEVEPLNDGTRRVKTLDDLMYIDPRGKKWTAPKGSVVDGASIPEMFQKVIGTPYGGEYTLASVIHDVACVEQKEPWEEVHQAFYDAMLASGVEEQKASTMYLAVYEGGARWGENRNKHLNPNEVLNLLGVHDAKSLIGTLIPFVEQLIPAQTEKKNMKLNEILDVLNIKIAEVNGK
jgi:hypothetical protein